MRSAIIDKASQDEQQNQTTITTNLNFIQKFLSIFIQRKLMNEVKMASDETETKKNNK